jgi:hypothetical protein
LGGRPVRLIRAEKQRGTFPCTQAIYVCCVTGFFYYCVTDSLLVATLGHAHRRATIQHVMTQRMRPGALRGMVSNFDEIAAADSATPRFLASCLSSTARLLGPIL